MPHTSHMRPCAVSYVSQLIYKITCPLRVFYHIHSRDKSTDIWFISTNLSCPASGMTKQSQHSHPLSSHCRHD